MPGTYVICLKLADRPCLIVGGGEVAERKVRSLLFAGARITVIAREIIASLRTLAEEKLITLYAREVSEDDLKEHCLVIAATDDRETNNKIAELAHRSGALLNVVDSPAESDFFVPSSLHRGDFTIAVATNGKMPALARRIRENLARQFGAEYEDYIRLLGAARVAIYKSPLITPDRKRRLVEALLDMPVLSLLREGKSAEAQKMVQGFLREHEI